MLSAQFIAYGWLNFGKSGFVKGLERVPEDLSKMDLKGRIALVTGGNAGLGYHTCEMLARAGARVLMVVRNLEKGKEAAQKIGGDVDVMLCDVSLQGDVDKLISQVSALDVLVLNAGTLFPNERVEIEGVERTLATNVVNNVQLIDGLLPVLRKSNDARVILVTSGGGLTEKLARNDSEYEQKEFDGTIAYARTKRMQMALAKRYARKEPSILFCSVHPGWSETDGVKTSIPGFYSTFKSSFRSASEGADTIAWLAATSRLRNPEERAKFCGALVRDRELELEHFRFAGTSYSQADEEEVYGYLKSKLRH